MVNGCYAVSENLNAEENDGLPAAAKNVQRDDITYLLSTCGITMHFIEYFFHYIILCTRSIRRNRKYPYTHVYHLCLNLIIVIMIYYRGVRD